MIVMRRRVIFRSSLGGRNMSLLLLVRVKDVVWWSYCVSFFCDFVLVFSCIVYSNSINTLSGLNSSLLLVLPCLFFRYARFFQSPPCTLNLFIPLSLVIYLRCLFLSLHLRLPRSFDSFTSRRSFLLFPSFVQSTDSSSCSLLSLSFFWVSKDFFFLQV